MDPIAIVSLVSSIAQLIDIANKVNDILRAFKDGDKELAVLRDDIAAFTESLHGFNRNGEAKGMHRVWRSHYMGYHPVLPFAPEAYSRYSLTARLRLIKDEG